MASHQIRTMGDPVLRSRAPEVTEIDGRLAATVDDMIETMYEAEGLGLAAPQVGIQQRFFVYDLDDGRGPQTIINPVIEESSGEWEFNEGCLSIPGLRLEIVRPKVVTLRGVDLDGREVTFQADELLARLFQHEMDHLDGVLMVERLDEDDRKRAMTTWRELQASSHDLAPRSDEDDDSNPFGFHL